jgi:hypothetical protein
MISLTLLLMMASGCSRQQIGRPYPDLSEPHMAAYSLAVALEQGNISAARGMIADDDGQLERFLDAAERCVQASGRVQALMERSFGRSFVPHFQGVELRIDRTRLVLAVSAATTRIDGQVAELISGLDVTLMQLRKIDGIWRITGIWATDRMTPIMDAVARTLNQFADDFQQSQFRTPVEAVKELSARRAQLNREI